MVRALAPFALAACLLGGCANLVLTKAINDPGPHDSPLTVMILGVVGDGLVGTGGAALHASISEDVEFREALPFYILPLLAADVLIAIIRIDDYLD